MQFTLRHRTMASWITQPKSREVRGPFPHSVLLVSYFSAALHKALCFAKLFYPKRNINLWIWICLFCGFPVISSFLYDFPCRSASGLLESHNSDVIKKFEVVTTILGNSLRYRSRVLNVLVIECCLTRVVAKKRSQECSWWRHIPIRCMFLLSNYKMGADHCGADWWIDYIVNSIIVLISCNLCVTTLPLESVVRM